MTSWNTIQNELKELNSSLPLQKVPQAYQVPKGYFENFADSVLLKIKKTAESVDQELESLSPVLAGLSKKMPFSLPEGYFNKISEDLSGIVADEPLPQVLAEAGKSMPYQVPSGYFENISVEVLKKLQPPKTTAKVVSFSSTKWMRYAVAAMVAGIIAVSGLVYYNSNQTANPTQSEDWIAKELKNVSDQELDAFIITTEENTTSLANNNMAAKKEIRSLLKDVPDSELEKFLDEVPFDSEEFSHIN